MALDHFDRIDWDNLDETDAVDAALLAKRDEHERYESDEATVDVVESEDGSVRCYVLYDRDPSSPREWDNAGHMVCWHRNYNLGDTHKFPDPEDFDETAKDWEGDDRIAVILDLYLYDHSGITMSCSPFSCPWDSGQVGYIYLTRGDMMREWGYKRLTAARRTKLESYLKAEVETYDQYLTGDVYGHVVVGGPNDGDSCWGYFGLKYAKEQAKEMVG